MAQKATLECHLESEFSYETLYSAIFPTLFYYHSSIKTNTILWSVLNEDFESHPYQHCYTSVQVQTDRYSDRQTDTQMDRQIFS